MKKVRYLIIIFITIIQVFVLLIYKKDSTKEDLISEEIPYITEVKKVKYIKDIESEFKNINNSTILSYNKNSDNNWIIKCIVRGNKTEIENTLNNIEDYNINSYNLSYDKENILLEMELISK